MYSKTLSNPRKLCRTFLWHQVLVTCWKSPVIKGSSFLPHRSPGRPTALQIESRDGFNVSISNEKPADWGYIYHICTTEYFNVRLFVTAIQKHRISQLPSPLGASVVLFQPLLK